MTQKEKVMIVLRLTISSAVIVFVILKLVGLCEKALYFTTPLMGVLMVVQSVQEWKEQRGMAIFGLCAALFIFVCTIAVWLQ